MTWNLSPSGWPTWADPGSDMEFDLADRGYVVIDESDVQAAIDAFHAGLPPVLQDVVTVAELGDPNSPASVALRAASVAAAAALLRTGERDDVAPVPATLSPALADNGFRNVGWMSADGTVVYTINSPTLRQSVNDAVTLTDVYNFGTGTSVHGLRDLDDGELLVSVLIAAGNAPGEVWKSSGYTKANPTAATWTKVLTTSGGTNGNYIQGQWGMSAHRNIVCLSEYGPNKTPPNHPRYAYLSTDYGKTFTTIYDMGAALTGHVHGVCYDPYDERIWIATGDLLVGQPTTTEHAIRYSDDLGKTWVILSLEYQPTGILALPNCVLMVSDMAPNGVYRIPRSRDKSVLPKVEIAHLLDNSPTGPTWLGGQMFRARRENAPALMPFSWAGTSGSGPGILLATVDGYNFHELWRDSISYGSTFGLQNTVGPTASGKIVGALKDGRQAANSRFTANAPAWSNL